MTIPILEARIEDAATILALQKSAYQSEAALHGDWNIPPLLQTLPQIEAEFAAKLFLKAMRGGEIIGSVRASLAAGTCHIGRLVVHPDHQGKGIGTQLTHAVEQAFPQAARFELFTGSKSQDNIRLYQRLGYRVFREEDMSPKVRLAYLEKWR